MPYAKATGTYLIAIKDWKIRNMIAGYIEARMLFKSFRLDAKNKRIIPSEELHKVCDALYKVKEHYQLLFRRPEDKSENGPTTKMQPNAAETAFLGNVGLLFHKVLMVRELRYVIENYPGAEATPQNGFETLKENLEQIDRFFDEGVQCVIDLIQAHRDNAMLITYLIEDSFRISKVLQVNCDELLMKMTEKATPETAYMMTARYYLESGWYDKATDMLKRVLKLNAANVEARQLLDRYSKIHALQN
jgi:hypothetical protein